MEIKLIEDVFGLVDLAELLFEVLGHIEHLARLILLPDVPYLYAQVVPREEIVVVDWRELGPRNGIDYIGEEVLARGIVLDHELRRGLVELRGDAQIAHVDVSFGTGE